MTENPTGGPNAAPATPTAPIEAPAPTTPEAPVEWPVLSADAPAAPQPRLSRVSQPHGV